jgi:hypothetical protein
MLSHPEQATRIFPAHHSFGNKKEAQPESSSNWASHQNQIEIAEAQSRRRRRVVTATPITPASSEAIALPGSGTALKFSKTMKLSG